MSYPAIAIADYFLLQSWSENRSLSPMQIQKLVYFAHGWYMAFFDGRLIYDPIEAWEYGPVIPSLYQRFKGFGIDEITKEDHYVWGPGVDPSDKNAIALLRKVWQVYGNRTGLQLSALTHAKDGPWHTVTSQHRSSSGKIPQHLRIPDQVIKEYFLNKKNSQA